MRKAARVWLQSSVLRLNLAADADEDRLDIWAHIALDNEVAAERLLDRIDEAFLLLREFPAAGRARDDLRPGLRTWPVGDYLIFYRVDPDALSILRIFHGSRDLPAHFDDAG